MAEHPDNRQLHALVLLSTLRTATEVRYALAERRAGRDPSEQEDARPVRAYLQAVGSEIGSLIARLRVSLVVEHEEQAAFVQAFEDRLTLSRLARELHVVHQRLLSLYPDVPESLIEAARLRQAEAEHLATASGEGFGALLTLWMDRATGFLEGLEKVLSEAN